jgi:ABC-type uncharacterized transport system YnjBCD substrate-binding protein
MAIHKRFLIRTGLITVLLISIVFTAFIMQEWNNRNIQSEINPEELIFYTATGDHYYRSLAKEFEELHQIPVRIVVCNEDVYIRKSISESKNFTGSIDGMIVNSSYQLQQLQQAKVTSETSTDFIPLYSTITGFLYDPLLLKNPPVSWDEFNLWIQDNPGEFGFTAVNGEGGFSFLYSVLSHIMDGVTAEIQNTVEWDPVWRWFRANRDAILLTSSDYDSLRLFSSGKLQLATIMEHQVLEAVKSGQIPPSAKMYVPDFGSVSEHYGMVIPENAPHREAAVLFSQFLKSDDSVSTMENMLFVRVYNGNMNSGFINSLPAEPGNWTRIYPQLAPPDALLYKRIIDTFKDKVLYY